MEFLTSGSFSFDFNIVFKMISESEPCSSSVTKLSLIDVWMDSSYSFQVGKFNHDPMKKYVNDRIHLRVEFIQNIRSSITNETVNNINISLLQTKNAINHSSDPSHILEILTAVDSESVRLKTTDGVILKACKQILGAHSSVFKRMFEIDMQEVSRNVVDIYFSGSVIQELLRFVYFRKVQEIEEFQLELYKAAKVFKIADLLETYLKNIRESLTELNALKLVEFAVLYDLNELFNECCEKIRR